jgi:hypothetical protein
LVTKDDFSFLGRSNLAGLGLVALHRAIDLEGLRTVRIFLTRSMLVLGHAGEASPQGI